MSVVTESKPLQANGKVLMALARAYTEKYPQRGFSFTLDGETVQVGTAPLTAITITDAEKTLSAIFTGGSIPLGDAFVDGKIQGTYWDIAEWARLFLHISREDDLLTYVPAIDKVRIATARQVSGIFKKEGANNRDDVNRHYSLEEYGVTPEDSNVFFEYLLAPSMMIYTCPWWSDDPNQTIEVAQQTKVDGFANLLGLKAGDRLVDLGSGWAAQALQYAERGVDVTLINLSDGQISYTQEQIQKRGLGNHARILRMDMLNLAELGENSFDAVESLEAVEHIAPNDHARLFSAVRHVLKPSGRAIIQSMYNKQDWPFDAWMDRHLWPGIRIPSQEHLTEALRSAFAQVDFTSYAYGANSRSFRVWLQNFMKHHDAMAALVPSNDRDRFMRGFGWYLACCSIVYEVHMDVGYWVCGQ